MKDTENKKQIQYAGFYKRLVASIIDLTLSTIALIPVFLVAKISMEQGPLIYSAIENMMLGIPTTQKEQSALQAFYINNFLQSAFLGLFIIAFWRWKGATPGKMLFSMHVVDAKTFEKPSMFQWILRLFGYVISVLPLCLGFIWIIVDKRKQAFHDKIARTVVILK